MPEPITALGFYNLATEEFNNGQYLKAIHNFEKSISHKEGWNSYHGLGWALFRIKKYPEAIDAFKKSLVLKEEWSSYKGLALSLHNSNRFIESIDPFKKVLELKKDWESYKGLGSSLFNSKQFKKAIVPFQKALEIKEDWDSYRGLGLALFHTKYFKEAIHSFRKSFSLIDLSSQEQIEIACRALAYAYKTVGNINASNRTWESYFSYTKPLISLDPFIGNERIYEKIDKNRLAKLNKDCNTFGLDFHASFKINNQDYLESWRYLMYLHIPKCGGSSFDTPLRSLKQYLTSFNNNTENLFESYKYFIPSNQLIKKDEFITLINSTKTDSYQNLKSIFLTMHSGPETNFERTSWSNLQRYIGKAIKICPHIITTVRDPHKRLLSHIKNESASSFDINDLLAKVEEENSRFNNVMHKYIFDYESSSRDLSSYSNINEIEEQIEKLDFIDISDASTISKVKSSFLSASFFPNILQHSRLNDSNNFKHERISNEQINYIFRKCLEKGFINKDESIDYDHLKNKTKNRLIFPSYEKKNIFLIHPLTFIFSKKNECFMIKTRELIKNPIKIIKTFNL